MENNQNIIVYFSEVKPSSVNIRRKPVILVQWNYEQKQSEIVRQSMSYSSIYFAQQCLSYIITARNEVGARLCFHRHVWFCSRGALPQCMLGYHTPREQTPPPRADTPQRRACWEIRSMRWRYASYWNAILFLHKFCFCNMDCCMRNTDFSIYIWLMHALVFAIQLNFLKKY